MMKHRTVWVHFGFGLLTVFAVAAVLAGGFFLWTRNNTVEITAQSSPAVSSDPTASPVASPSPSPSPPTSVGQTPIPIDISQVSYDLSNSNLPKAEPLQKTPSVIRAVYLTEWAAGNPKKIQYVLNMAQKGEINAVVIDIKDYSGYIAYHTSIPAAATYHSQTNRIPDINALLTLLHKHNVYAIARVTVFQDPVLAKVRPDLAVHSLKELNPDVFTSDKQELQMVQEMNGTATPTPAPPSSSPQLSPTPTPKLVTAYQNPNLTDATLWHDNLGLGWMDPSSKEVWQYNVALAKDASDRGFDEINFDYVRFPSDGLLADMSFPKWNVNTPKSEVISQFFTYLSDQLPNVTISADLFGLTTVKRDDMGIGQIIETVFGKVNYLCPMVYPSLYADGFHGYAIPADHPYQVIDYSLSTAQQRLQTFNATHPGVGTTLRNTKLRPWLQDYDLHGVVYDKTKVVAEMQATEDALQDNFVGYMLWNPSNVYTESALEEGVKLQPKISGSSPSPSPSVFPANTSPAVTPTASPTN